MNVKSTISKIQGKINQNQYKNRNISTMQDMTDVVNCLTCI